jgi:hypothetical protein
MTPRALSNSLELPSVYSSLISLSLTLLLLGCSDPTQSDPVNFETEGGEWIPADPQQGTPPSAPNGDPQLMIGGGEAGAEPDPAGVVPISMGGEDPPPMGGTGIIPLPGGQEEMGGAEGGEMTPPLPPDPRVNAGWIGGPCSADRECPYENGYCITENGGYPRGMCTQDCAEFCPDLDGMPVTFCVPGVTMSGGACVQRCDPTAFPGTGCRPGYSCVNRPRVSDASFVREVCLPSAQVETPMMSMPPDNAGECIEEITRLNINYTYSGDILDHPSTHPNLDCFVEDSVRASSPINGVSYRYVEHSSAQPIFGSCALVQAMHELSEMLAEYDIVEVAHIGTYNCRVIGGTNTLSRHGYGDALDIAAFTTRDGTEYNVVEDWEHGVTSNFRTVEGRMLYEISREIYNRQIFNYVLTPEFNAAHDNHFHIDLTPGNRFYGKMDDTPQLGCGGGH